MMVPLLLFETIINSNYLLASVQLIAPFVQNLIMK